MSKKLNKDQALVLVAHYIIDDKEHDDYALWCEQEGLNPRDIQGERQRKHVYAQALIGLGMEYKDAKHYG